MPRPRQTVQTGLVLSVLLEDPGCEVYGKQITDRLGLPSGTISPILQRLEGESWLESWWEDRAEATAEGRPRRRFYRLTGLGVREAPAFRDAVAARFPGILRPNIGGAALGTSC